MLVILIDADAQVTVIDVSRCCVTVMVKLFEVMVLVNSPTVWMKLAVMPVDPAATPVTSPLLAMLATPVFEEFQVTWPVMLADVLLL